MTGQGQRQIRNAPTGGTMVPLRVRHHNCRPDRIRLVDEPCSDAPRSFRLSLRLCRYRYVMPLMVVGLVWRAINPVPALPADAPAADRSKHPSRDVLSRYHCGRDAGLDAFLRAGGPSGGLSLPSL